MTNNHDSSLLLQGTPNRFGGLQLMPQDIAKILDATDVLNATDALLPIQFDAILKRSLEVWDEQSFKVIWVQLENKQAAWLASFYQAGFENHHCKQGTITLVKKLQTDALVPIYANHSIGVGGLVINERDELLTIRELAHVNNYPNNWKFPGGMLDLKESFEAGVKREIMEETGVKTEFNSFLGFRHHHIGQFQTSNIYAVCRLTPLSHNITIQESEIFDARWFPIKDYLADPKIGEMNKVILKSAISSHGMSSIKLAGYREKDADYEIFTSIFGNH